MKKSVAFLSVFFACFSFASAQVSVDPNDEFYREAQGWELRGLTKPLPLLRPYPLNVIKDILNSVIVNGNDEERELAEKEWNRVFGKRAEFYLNAGFDFKHSASQEDSTKGIEAESKNDKNLQGEIGVRGDAILHSLVGVGYNIGFYGESADYSVWSPYKVSKAQDSIFDPATVSKIDVYNNWNMNIQFGNSTVYATAGVSRVGFGPFIGEGLALNDMGYHSANIVFSANREKWSYSSVFEVIGAAKNTKLDDLSAGKFLAFHVIQYRFSPKLAVSYYENIISGPSFNVAYLFPAPYMAVQNIGGASDNLQMGFLFEVKPTKGLNWATDIFVDDIEVDDIVKLHFDTKIRVGAQSGFVFTPEKSVLSRLASSYQIVLPYVYAHWDYDSETDSSGKISGSTANYQNYLNAGVGIGANLDPNSDKVSFSAKFNPLKNLSLCLSTAFIRHANSAEAFGEEDAAEYVLASSGQYLTDGSASMHQMFSDESEGATRGRHVAQAWDELGFMTSAHKMYVCQAGLSAQYDFPRTTKGQFSLTFGYTFEYIKNAGVDSNVYKGGNINWSQQDDGYYVDGAKVADTWEDFEKRRCSKRSKTTKSRMDFCFARQSKSLYFCRR